MSYLAAARAFLESFHPAVPWALLTLATWFGVYSVRRWIPSAWRALELWGPDGTTAAKVFQALPSILFGALVSVALTGGDYREAIKGAAAGALAPLFHHAMKAYRGSAGSNEG